MRLRSKLLIASRDLVLLVLRGKDRRGVVHRVAKTDEYSGTMLSQGGVAYICAATSFRVTNIRSQESRRASVERLNFCSKVRIIKGRYGCERLKLKADCAAAVHEIMQATPLRGVAGSCAPWICNHYCGFKVL
jgi:hypothetical protein